MYALCDCNNFFVSCERVFRPDLRNKPVVVLSGNDGCVVARSNEVKKLGIKMGVPFYQIRQLAEECGIVRFSSNFELYGDLSSRIMTILGRYTDMLQQYSIDEAYLDISYCDDTAAAKELGTHIKNEIQKGVGVPVSIGIADTKTLCKVAADYAKHYAGYKGVCAISTVEQRRKALAGFPVEDVWGIGRQSAAKLHKAGVTTALEFADHTEVFAKNLLNLPGLQTWRELNGVDCIRLNDSPEKASITCSRTFAHGVTDRNLLEQALSEFCTRVAEKLRRQHCVCSEMAVFADTSRFLDNRQTLYVTLHFPVPTDNTQEMNLAMLQAVRQRWKPDTPYKRAGVVLLSIRPGKGVQQSLFDDRNRQRDMQLQKTIDLINFKSGKRTVGFVPQVDVQKAKDLYSVGAKSPAYSTRIEDIITLHC